MAAEPLNQWNRPPVKEIHRNEWVASRGEVREAEQDGQRTESNWKARCFQRTSAMSDIPKSVSGVFDSCELGGNGAAAIELVHIKVDSVDDQTPAQTTLA